MKWIAPSYYPTFHCIADQCVHNCCIGWEIDIDTEKLAYYETVEGKLGERLCCGIETKGETPHFRLGEGERCPFLNQSGLCDLILELGEESLCQVCRDHPRFRSFFSDRTEIGVGLCCEAACDLILSWQAKVILLQLEEDGEREELEPPDASLLAWREELFAAAQDRSRPTAERAATILEMAEITLPKKSRAEWAEVYLGLERLEETWTTRLKVWQETDLTEAPTLDTPEWEVAWEQLLVYFLYRHLTGALEDGEYEGRAAFAVLSFMVIRQLCQAEGVQKGRISLQEGKEIVRAYSAEIEYSDENVEALLDCILSA